MSEHEATDGPDENAPAQEGRGDPTQPPYIETRGFLLQDEDEGFYRLYDSLKFDVYRRFRRDELVAAGPPGVDAKHLEPSTVRVRATARLERITASADEMSERLRAGRFTTDFDPAPERLGFPPPLSPGVHIILSRTCPQL